MAWQRRFFRDPIFSPSDPHTEAAAPAEAAFLWRALGLRRGSRVLDVACGTGRHAVRLAKRGALVTGVDVTDEYLSRVPRVAGLEVRKMDMRRLRFRGVFDAAVNLWTSFGYFDDPADDLLTLQATARALKPGGLFLLDVLDFAAVRKAFQPQQFRQRPDGAFVMEECALRGGPDPALLSRWTVLPPRGKPESVDFFVRGYDEKRLSALLRKAGFSPLRRWGTLDGKKRGPRLVVLSRLA